MERLDCHRSKLQQQFQGANEVVSEEPVVEGGKAPPAMDVPGDGEQRGDEAEVEAGGDVDPDTDTPRAREDESGDTCIHIYTK